MADWFTDADVQAVAELMVTQYACLDVAEMLCWRDYEPEARAILASLAPRIAQERADALREFAAQVEATYPQDVFPEGGTSVDARSASMARCVARQALARADDIEQGTR